jgi:puromycin-sensitive aminopeptidase
MKRCNESIMKENCTIYFEDYNASMKKTSQRSVRLSPDVTPARYRISLKPNFETFTFAGDETITLTIKKPTTTITLHAIELEITSASIGESAASVSYDKKRETATLSFKTPIQKGEAELSIAFVGTLNDKMHGFYRSNYQREGATHWIATTQFESTDARRAFPCFDEPAMKAVFDISLTIPAGMEAISNTMPIKKSTNADGSMRVDFSPTPVMSTYLLAFIVGEFEHVQKKSKDGVLVRVFTTPGKKEQATFALECAARIVSFFNQYFAIRYPLPVLDMIAIPDFSAGAMENWGAITYRESALLVDPKHSSTQNRQWVALVIAHEIAHQWFGNLVTMNWWTHLWLNEGFASYIEYLAVNHLFPEWDIWTQFLVADHAVALHYDGLEHTHPIEVEVHDPAEIASVFDAVSYSKGASVIRMLAEYLGEKTFRDGLRLYLKTHRYANAETADLWRALSRISGKPVAKIMANWTAKPGYPLLSLEQKRDHFTLTQSRFFASPVSQKKTRDATLWRIPLSFIHEKKRGKVLIEKRTVKIPNTGDYFKLNAGETSFVRTSYPAAVRDSLGEAIEAKRLETRDRVGLVRDMFALVENGAQTAVAALSFARHYGDENEYVVWSEICGGLSKLHSLIAHEAYEPAFNAYARSLLTEIGATIRWDAKPKSHSAALLKSLILETLAKYGDAAVLEHARLVFDSIDETANPVVPDLRGVVYNTVARHGGEKEYAKLLRLYESAVLHEEKNRIGRALGLFRQTELLAQTLEFAISDGVRRQDCVRMIMAVTVNPHGRDLAWSFIKANWKFFTERFQGSRDLAHLIEPMGSSALLADAKDVQAFLKTHPTPGTERTLKQVLERIHSNAAWLKRGRKELEQFLSA